MQIMEIEKYVLYRNHAKPMELFNRYSTDQTGSTITVEEFQIANELKAFFPDIVLLRMICERKTLKGNAVVPNFPLKLTSEALCQIPITSILKIKLYSNKRPNSIALKVETEKNEYFFYLQKADVTALFSKLLWLRLTTMNIFADESSIFEDQIFGSTLINVALFGKWEKKIIKISRKKGLQVFQNQSKGSIIKSDHLSEFWTRFEIIQDKKMLVVKAFVGHLKYEFGIEINHDLLGWLQAFCYLVVRA